MDPWYKVATPRKEVREGRSFDVARQLAGDKGVEALGAEVIREAKVRDAPSGA